MPDRRVFINGLITVAVLYEAGEAGSMNPAPSLHEHLDALDRLPPPERRRTIREQSGLSLRFIAEELNVTPSAVHAWERGLTPGRTHLYGYVALLERLAARIHRQIDIEQLP